MKKITLSLITLTAFSVLAGCSDKVIKEPETKKSAAKKNTENVEVAEAAVALACPVINDKFVRNNAAPVEIATKREGDKFSYSINGSPLILADGKANRIAMEVVTLTCDATTITLVTQENEGVAVTKTYSLDGEKQLKVEASDKSLNLDGFYTLEEKVTPPVDQPDPNAPAPQPEPEVPAPAEEPTPAPETVPSAACPSLNGTYATADVSEGNTNITIEFASKEEAGKFSYNIDKMGFFAADGEKRKAISDVENDSISLTCDANSVTMVYEAPEQEAETRKYIVAEADKIVVEGTGQSASYNGTYSKL